MRIRKIPVWLFLLAPILASAEEQKLSQFIGPWCTNPCAFGSTSRPWNLPCGFEITENEIRWAQWNDKKKKFVRKYVVTEQKENEEVLLVYGGSENEWYAHKSMPNAKHKLTLLANHSNQFYRDGIKLNEESWSEKDKKWSLSGSMYIMKNGGPCP